MKRTMYQAARHTPKAGVARSNRVRDIKSNEKELSQ